MEQKYGLPLTKKKQAESVCLDLSRDTFHWIISGMMAIVNNWEPNTSLINPKDRNNELATECGNMNVERILKLLWTCKPERPSKR